MTAEAEAGISESIAAMANSLMTSLDSARRELQVHLRESEMNQAERAFLADASARLSSSLDFDETVDQIVQMVVPKLGDYATIDVNRDDGQMIQVAQAAVDPEHRQYVRSLRSRYEIDMPDNTPVGYVASTGKSLHFSTDEQGVIRSHTVGIESVAGLQAPNINSALFVPLIARDQTIGVLQLVHAGSRRWHSQRDQALAEDLAKRAALAMENARLYREAREAGQAREEFLSIASHELKTPLTTVKGYIQILQRSVEKDPIEPERVRQAVDHLELQAMRIEALVSDLLDASRIRQGKLELRPETMDLRETTRRVISRFVDAPERDATHSLSLEANEPVYGEWDPFRIDQVISNLVSNALKYSTEGGAIRVLLNCEGDDAVLAVQDEGMGISSDGQANLFEPFFRDPQMQRRVGGTGLGLYITRQIVESHGGSIQVETQRGVGSTFTVRLPRTISLHGSGDQDG